MFNVGKLIVSNYVAAIIVCFGIAHNQFISMVLGVCNAYTETSADHTICPVSLFKCYHRIYENVRSPCLINYCVTIVGFSASV